MEIELVDLEFETDVIVVGYIAAIYSASATVAPIRHWARDARSKALPIGNSLVTATATTRKIGGRIVAGVSVVIHHDHYRGGNRKTKRFIPFESLKNVVVSVKGIEE